MVKGETSDLTVPANAEIVLEGRVITSEGLVHESPYGEYTGTYGGGEEILAHNWNVAIDCITYRRDAIYQHATIAETPDGRTQVDLDHDGFGESDPALAMCNTLWGTLLGHLKDYAETATPSPAFP